MLQKSIGKRLFWRVALCHLLPGNLQPAMAKSKGSKKGSDKNSKKGSKGSKKGAESPPPSLQPPPIPHRECCSLCSSPNCCLPCCRHRCPPICTYKHRMIPECPEVCCRPYGRNCDGSKPCSRPKCESCKPGHEPCVLPGCSEFACNPFPPFPTPLCDEKSCSPQCSSGCLKSACLPGCLMQCCTLGSQHPKYRPPHMPCRASAIAHKPNCIILPPMICNASQGDRKIEGTCDLRDPCRVPPCRPLVYPLKQIDCCRKPHRYFANSGRFKINVSILAKAERDSKTHYIGI